MNNAFKYLAKFDKDTFIIGLFFVVTMIGLVNVKADPIYLVGFSAFSSILYVGMRYALLKVQVEEQSKQVKRSSRSRAKEVIEATATKSEKVELEKFITSVKRDQK